MRESDKEAEGSNFKEERDQVPEISEVEMAEPQTLRQLTAPDLTNTPLCIVLPTVPNNSPVELKSALINSFPTFME